MKGDKCSRCDKKAIGYEAFSNRSGLNVCEDHASDRTIKMKPGTRKEKGNYLYIRY